METNNFFYASLVLQRVNWHCFTTRWYGCCLDTWQWGSPVPTSTPLDADRFLTSVKYERQLYIRHNTSGISHHGVELMYQQNVWNDVVCPTKLRESLWQVRVTSDTQKIQSTDWPKWPCMLWRNVNSRLFIGHSVDAVPLGLDSLTMELTAS